MQDNIIGVSSTTYVGHSFKDVVKSVSEVGFKYLELVSAPGINEHINPRPEVISKKEIQHIKNYCNNYGIEIFALGGHSRLLKNKSLENFKKVLDMAEILNVKYVSTDTGEIENKEDEKIFYKEIIELINYASTKNISICIEMHGNWFNSGKKGYDILKSIGNPNIKINYDTGNVIYFDNTRPENDIKYALPFLGFIHLKDSSGKYKDWDFPPIGDGKVDFKKIFEAIKDYKGPISLEIEFDGKVQPIKKISNGLKKSKEFLEGYGFHKFS